MATSKKSAKKPAKKSAKRSSKKATGSQKLRAARGAAGGGGTGVLARALSTLTRARINHDILIRGTPRPDIITGTFRARSGTEIGNALRTLFGIPGIEYKPIRLFPKGIPVIDIIEAQVEGRLRTR